MGFLCPVTAFDLGQSKKELEHQHDARNVPLCIAQLPVEVRSPLFSGLETMGGAEAVLLWDLGDSNKAPLHRGVICTCPGARTFCTSDKWRAIFEVLMRPAPPAPSCDESPARPRERASIASFTDHLEVPQNNMN